MDGFAAGDFATKWTIVGVYQAPMVVGTATPRVPGGSYLYNTGAAANTIQQAFTATAEIFYGFGLRLMAGVTSWNTSIFSDAAVTCHLVLQRSAAGFLELRRGTTTGTILATGTTAISDDVWHYIEIRATVADSGGICQVHLDGNATPEIDFTGDTRNAGTSVNIDAVRQSVRNASTVFLTDVYILNTTGAAPLNTWLGDVAVRTLSPSGNGTTSQFVGSDADSTDNYALVDELPVSTSDWVGSATVGHKDTYAIADLPAGVQTVYGLAWNANVAKTDAGDISAAPVIRSGATDYVGSTFAPSTSYVTRQVIYATDPATSAAWTPAGVNAIEAGVQVA